MNERENRGIYNVKENSMKKYENSFSFLCLLNKALSFLGFSLYIAMVILRCYGL